MSERTYSILISSVAFIALAGLLKAQAEFTELFGWLNWSAIALAGTFFMTLMMQRMDPGPGLPKWVRATPQFRLASALVLGWFPALLACYAVFALFYMHASGDRVAWVLCILAGNVGEGMGEAWGARSRD